MSHKSVAEYPESFLTAFESQCIAAIEDDTPMPDIEAAYTTWKSTHEEPKPMPQAANKPSLSAVPTAEPKPKLGPVALMDEVVAFESACLQVHLVQDTILADRTHLVIGPPKQAKSLVI